MASRRLRPTSPKAGKAGARGAKASAAAAAGKGRRRPRAPSEQPRSWRAVVGRFVGRLVARVAGLALVATFGFVAWCALGLPDISDMGGGDRAGSVSVFAADGTFTAAYGDVYGGYVNLENVSPTLIDAVLAIEDRRFFRHWGFDPLALGRAALANWRAGRVVQGGSTITQQLAKLAFLTPARTLERKVQEMLLAFWLELRFEKAEILASYLNRAYFGAGAYGIATAARRYFGTTPARLTLAQSAMLAGLLRAPSRLAPTRHPDRARARAEVVLTAMVAAGRVEASAAAAARERPARVTGGDGTAWGGRFFADWVVNQTGPARDRTKDVEIVATLVPPLQLAAERALRAGLADHPGIEGGLVAMSLDGAVLAMAGGRSYARSQFNRVTQAARQPGSAFKIFVYLAALEAGRHPDDRVRDAPVTVGNWSPRNYNNVYRGEITLREAFARSSNSVAVRLVQDIGRGRVIRLAERLGITAELDDAPSLALGVSEVTLLDMTAALVAVANGGSPVLPYGYVEVRTRPEGTVWERTPAPRRDGLSASTIEAMRDLLGSVVTSGTGRRARLDGVQAFGKTGTTQDHRDAWFIGFAGDVVCGVWIGRDDSGPMDGIVGGGPPAEIWQAFMQEALAP